MSTDITSEHRRVFEMLTSGQHSNIALFSVLASRADLRRAAELRPVFYRDYVALEQRIGHTLSPSRVPPAGVDRCSGRARRRRFHRPAGRSDSASGQRTPALATLPAASALREPHDQPPDHCFSGNAVVRRRIIRQQQERERGLGRGEGPDAGEARPSPFPRHPEACP